MRQAALERLEFVNVPTMRDTPSFASIVEQGLSSPQRSLPCRFFYDRIGSELFEQICDLPEYYLTRTERLILERYAGQIVAAMGAEVTIVEFGSGSSIKTRLLLEAALKQQRKLDYVPIDISADFLRQCSIELLGRYDRLRVIALAGEYLEALHALPHSGAPRLILFLGSSIGNFTYEEAVDFLTHIRREMRPEDRLLIGFDLLKDTATLEAAYNDAKGITAQFNRNVLGRINRELGGCFDLNCFRHHAPYIPDKSRIEMRLICERRHEVHIAALDRSFSFIEGEQIHTENCCKYTHAMLDTIARDGGLAAEHLWQDDKEWFALALLRCTYSMSADRKGAINAARP